MLLAKVSFYEGLQHFRNLVVVLIMQFQENSALFVELIKLE